MATGLKKGLLVLMASTLFFQAGYAGLNISTSAAVRGIIDENTEPPFYCESINLGEYTIDNGTPNIKGWITNGTNGASTNLSMADVKAAKQLVVEFSVAPSGSFQFIWQGDASNWSWKDTLDIKADGNVLTIDLASMRDWNKAITGEGIWFYIGYWDTTLDKLGMTNAYLTVEPPAYYDEYFDLGGYTIIRSDNYKGWITNGTNGASTNLSMADVKAAKQLVVEFSAPVGKHDFQFIWQGDVSNWSWKETNGIKADGDVLTIDLASMKDWEKAVTGDGIWFYIGYWGDYDFDLDYLGMTNAYFVYKVDGPTCPQECRKPEIVTELSKIEKLPKTEYLLGEALDLTGMEVLIYNDVRQAYSKINITNSNVEKGWYTPWVVGTQTVTITHLNRGKYYTFSFDVTVNPPENDWIVTIPTILGVAKPRPHATPVSEIIESTQFTGTVDWNSTQKKEVKTSTATITLTAKPGFTFDGVPKNFFFVPGAESTTSAASVSKEAVVTAVFLNTVKDPNMRYIAVERDITVAEAVAEMGLGWNLGNSLDALGSETAWGNPLTTKAMIDKIADAGFNVLRIPITWGTGDRVGNGPDYMVAQWFLERVEEVVNWGLENDMYVILNTHHENEWLSFTDSGYIANSPKISAIWAQIAGHFQGYGDKLIFETLNEPGQKSKNGTADAATYYNNLNRYNQDILNAIRSTGGSNENRLVLAPAYGASVDAGATNAFVLPTDLHPDRLIASVHVYSPLDFAMNPNQKHNQWGADKYKEKLENRLAEIDSAFIQKGIPVIIGEFGARDKENEEARAQWAKYFVSHAKEYGIPCIWWDNNLFTGSDEKFGLFNRSSLTFPYTFLLQGLIEGLYPDFGKLVEVVPFDPTPRPPVKITPGPIEFIPITPPPIVIDPPMPPLLTK